MVVRKKSPIKKTASKKNIVKRAVIKRAAPAKKAVTRKAVIKRAAPAKKTVTRKAAVKKPAKGIKKAGDVKRVETVRVVYKAFTKTAPAKKTKTIPSLRLKTKIPTAIALERIRLREMEGKKK